MTKILLIGHIRNESGDFLMRKKFKGSEPYSETWYHFGCEITNGENPEKTFEKYMLDFIGIEITLQEKLHWETEIKIDHDGREKQFIYLYADFVYIKNEIILPKELEKIEWISKEIAKNLDIVPPSRKFLSKINLL